MTIRTIEGVRLTHTDKGWAAPNDRFVFRKTPDGWLMSDYGLPHLEGLAAHPFMGPGEGYHPTLAAAVREAKELIVLEGPLNSGEDA